LAKRDFYATQIRGSSTAQKNAQKGGHGKGLTEARRNYAQGAISVRDVYRPFSEPRKSCFQRLKKTLTSNREE